MKRIASRDNPFFRSLRLLADDSIARRDTGLAIVEGVHLCDAWLQNGGIPRAVVVGASALDDAEVRGILERAAGGDRYVFDDALFAAVSRLANGVALLMVVERPRPTPPDRLLATAVLLDRVQDPGNVGSILRSAAAAGIRDVYLSAGCASAWSPKVVRAAMGAHFSTTTFEDCALADLARGAAVALVATSPHASRSLYDLDLTGHVAWLFGHEGQGVHPSLTIEATLVRIPQPGRMESLNVAASAAVCLFEQVRQRTAAARA